ncbi:MAG: hypothetical protein HOJ35_07405 [Bdellovibrionales bacterium]|jgi:hypothetical protein|nr:hypothetical protein [Bdellovibrionales bacterium]
MKIIFFFMFLICCFDSFAEKGRSSNLASCTTDMGKGFFMCIEYIGSIWYEPEEKKDQKKYCKGVGYKWSENTGCNTSGVWGTALILTPKNLMNKKVYLWFTNVKGSKQGGNFYETCMGERDKYKSYEKKGKAKWSGTDCSEFL